MTRVAVLGGGAIGSSLCALMWQAGHRDLVMIGRPDQVEAIRASGLRIDGALGRLAIPLPVSETCEEPADVLFLTVKTQDVVGALRSVGKLPASTILVICQNGVEAEALAASACPGASIVGAVVNIHASYLTPGCVTISYPGPVVIGRSIGPPDAAVEHIRVLLDGVLPVTKTANLIGVRWFKLIINLNNAFPAICDLSFDRVLNCPGVAQYAVRAMREGLVVASNLGVRLEGLPDTTLVLTKVVRYLPVPLAAAIVRARATRIARRGPLLGSTLQSLRRRRPSEVTHLNGVVDRLAQLHGQVAPINRLLTTLVHRVEATGRYLSPEELVAECIEAEGNVA